MSAAGEKVNRNIEWVVDKLGNLLGYKRGHQDVVNLVSATTDSSGATVLEAGGAQIEVMALEVANKVDTAENLRLYAGVDGQISCASDTDSLYRHNGVASGAVAYRRSKFAGRAVLNLASLAVANGAALDFAGGAVVVDDLGIISTANDNITIPAGIDYYDVNLYLPLSEQAGATNTQRKISMLIDGAAPSRYQITGLTDITLTEVHSGQINGDIKHVTKIKALTNVLTFIFSHNSAVNPNIGGPATFPRITIDMYRND